MVLVPRFALRLSIVYTESESRIFQKSFFRSPLVFLCSMRASSFFRILRLISSTLRRGTGTPATVLRASDATNSRDPKPQNLLSRRSFIKDAEHSRRSCVPVQEYILIPSSCRPVAAFRHAPPPFAILRCLRPGVTATSCGQEIEQARTRGEGRTPSNLHWKN